MKAFDDTRLFTISAFLLLLVFLLTPSIGQALRPLDEDGLVQHSPELKSVPSSDSHLKPINETQLEALSPSLAAPEKQASEKILPLMDQKFQNSICFKRCHSPSDFHPKDHTAKQWRLLIEQNGHSLFEQIPWESQAEKEEIVDYLLNHSRNTNPAPAGIGVW